jgi:hypothetical protein
MKTVKAVLKKDMTSEFNEECLGRRAFPDDIIIYKGTPMTVSFDRDLKHMTLYMFNYRLKYHINMCSTIVNFKNRPKKAEIYKMVRDHEMMSVNNMPCPIFGYDVMGFPSWLIALGMYKV